MAMMPTPVPATPTPVAVTPVPVAVVPTPAYLFGFEPIHLPTGANGGMGICVSRRRPLAFRQRRPCKRNGSRAGGERSRSGRKSKGEFQKLTAFHTFPLHASRVMHEEFDGIEMNAR
jgi:hypothetical protein